MKRFVQSLVLFGALFAIGGVNQAAANLIVNGSFEDNTVSFVSNVNVNDDTMNLNVGATNLAPWSVITGDAAWIGPANPFGLTASAGDYFLDLTGYERTAHGGVTQSFSTQIGGTYLLTFDIGNSTNYNSAGSSIWATAGNNSVIFGNNTSSTNSWLGAAMMFQATATNTLVTLQGWAGDHYIGLDNVSVVQLSSPVPEPSTFALAGLGVVGLAITAYRRRATRKI